MNHFWMWNLVILTVVGCSDVDPTDRAGSEPDAAATHSGDAATHTGDAEVRDGDADAAVRTAVADSGVVSPADAGSPAVADGGQRDEEDAGTVVDSRGCKRGVAYGHHSERDLEAFSPAVSWWYNWDFRPDRSLGDASYEALGVEYVPMIWGGQSDRPGARAAIAQTSPAAKTLLGFNEPNFGEQANLSATEAAALWPELEEIADLNGLKLASPAANYCGGNCQDTDPFNYLNEFFAACQDCRVDYLAVHVYVGCAPGRDNKAVWLIDHLERYKREFSLPIWLTEFACDNATDPAQQLAFMEDSVAYLEAEPRVERYAWFAGRAENVPHVDLLGEDGELTELGRSYVAMPHNGECERPRGGRQ